MLVSGRAKKLKFMNRVGQTISGIEVLDASWGILVVNYCTLLGTNIYAEMVKMFFFGKGSEMLVLWRVHESCRENQQK